MKLYISNGTWFDEGTICILEDDYRNDASVPMDAGLFYGFRTCKVPEAENRHLGERYLDGEVCNFSEFEEIDLDERFGNVNFKRFHTIGK